MHKTPDTNYDSDVVAGFGTEWKTFRHRDGDLPTVDHDAIFQRYFAIFPWQALPQDGGVGIDVGCGSGRWAKLVAPRVRHLYALDASSDAVAVARANLATTHNVSLLIARAGAIPLMPKSLDFAFSLGVLHHIPDTGAAIAEIANKLKPGAPFLVYLYYAFDNRPRWYRMMWQVTEPVRFLVSRLPYPARLLLSRIIACSIYWPLARAALVIEKLKLSPHDLPLASYRHLSFYVLQTDAYDRFCTRLERRFSRAQICHMLGEAGFRDVQFSDSEPFGAPLP